MNSIVNWMAAAAETSSAQRDQNQSRSHNPQPVAPIETRVGHPVGEGFAFRADADVDGDWEWERERRIYRGRTVAMLRRYMRYSMETGRLPSVLGREFFRSKVTSYTVVTFEDRVIFVHDMETCLEKLDEFSKQIIARHILQEHDRGQRHGC
jgi:hypothetical protein